MERGTKTLQPSFEPYSDLLTSPSIVTIYFELRKALDLRYALEHFLVLVIGIKNTGHFKVILNSQLNLLEM